MALTPEQQAEIDAIDAQLAVLRNNPEDWVAEQKKISEDCLVRLRPIHIAPDGEESVGQMHERFLRELDSDPDTQVEAEKTRLLTQRYWLEGGC